jgi:hypothetical protein
MFSLLLLLLLFEYNTFWGKIKHEYYFGQCPSCLLFSNTICKMDLFMILSAKRGKVPTHQGLSGRALLNLMGPKVFDSFVSLHLIKERDPKLRNAVFKMSKIIDNIKTIITSTWSLQN